MTQTKILMRQSLRFWDQYPIYLHEKNLYHSDTMQIQGLQNAPAPKIGVRDIQRLAQPIPSYGIDRSMSFTKDEQSPLSKFISPSYLAMFPIRPEPSSLSSAYFPPAPNKNMTSDNFYKTESKELKDNWGIPAPSKLPDQSEIVPEPSPRSPAVFERNTVHKEDISTPVSLEPEETDSLSGADAKEETDRINPSTEEQRVAVTEAVQQDGNEDSKLSHIRTDSGFEAALDILYALHSEIEMSESFGAFEEDVCCPFSDTLACHLMMYFDIGTSRRPAA